MNDIIISYNDSIKNALHMLQENKKRFLMCINEDNIILGTITDGDIRRSFLNGAVILDLVEKVINRDFKYLTIDSSFDEVCEKFKSDKIDFLPIVNNKMKLINVITKKQFHIMLLENVKFDLNYDFSKFNNRILEHEIYNRPWGFYKSIILTSHAQGKIITVFPKSELSLQEHKKREEHWVIIKGKGQVILGESKLNVYPGKYVYIPKGCKHQIINDTNENIIFSEVQLGKYFGEDDIIRYNDKYGRVKYIKEGDKNGI
jgi:mannose-1-phosphate guanylyltransferase/mannose-6-phosphate isomerase